MSRDGETSFVLGDWNAACDRCDFDFKASQLRAEWNGMRVCHGPGTNQCWEPRHPLDFKHGKADNQAVPWTRPQSVDNS